MNIEKRGVIENQEAVPRATGEENKASAASLSKQPSFYRRIYGHAAAQASKAENDESEGRGAVLAPLSFNKNILNKGAAEIGKKNETLCVLPQSKEWAVHDIGKFQQKYKKIKNRKRRKTKKKGKSSTKASTKKLKFVRYKEAKPPKNPKIEPKSVIKKDVKNELKQRIRERCASQNRHERPLPVKNERLRYIRRNRSESVTRYSKINKDLLKTYGYTRNKIRRSLAAPNTRNAQKRAENSRRKRNSSLRSSGYEIYFYGYFDQKSNNGLSKEPLKSSYGPSQSGSNPGNRYQRLGDTSSRNYLNRLDSIISAKKGQK